MKVQEAIDLVQNRIQYRDGVAVRIYYDPLMSAVRLAVHWRAPDVNNPERIGDFGSVELIDEGFLERMDEPRLIRWVFDRIRWAEDHEAREWFRVDGVKIFDPHKEEPRNAPDRSIQMPEMPQAHAPDRESAVSTGDAMRYLSQTRAARPDQRASAGGLGAYLKTVGRRFGLAPLNLGGPWDERL